MADSTFQHIGPEAVETIRELLRLSAESSYSSADALTYTKAALNVAEAVSQLFHAGAVVWP